MTVVIASPLGIIPFLR